MKLVKELHLNKKLFKPTIEEKSVRDGYGDQIVIEGQLNDDIVALCADLTESSRLHHFREKFPKRFFEMGVSEQNMAGIAAGLAIGEKIPFMSSYGVFSPGYNWGQIRLSIAYSNSNVKIVSSAGLGNDLDGATHQALEDLALMRTLPNMTVVSPCDYEQAKKATEAIAEHKGPVYMRSYSKNLPVVTTKDTPFELGKAYVLSEGEDITVIATGPSVYDALEASNKAHKEKNINVEVINVPTIKPLDTEAILKSVKKTNKVITVEEHQINGGLGSAIAELLAQEYPTKIRLMGIKDTFTESGPYKKLKSKYKISSNDIYNEIVSFA